MTPDLFDDLDDPAAVMLLAAGWWRKLDGARVQWTTDGVNLYGTEDALAEQRRRDQYDAS